MYLYVHTSEYGSTTLYTYHSLEWQYIEIRIQIGTFTHEHNVYTTHPHTPFSSDVSHPLGCIVWGRGSGAQKAEVSTSMKHKHTMATHYTH